MASVVQEWASPRASPSSPSTRRLDSIVRNRVLEHGVEKPKGYNVSFHYNSEVEKHHFGRHHPMKPWRLQLTKQLVFSYGLQYTMDLHETQAALKDEMAEFHKLDYLEFLEHITPDNMLEFQSVFETYKIGEDCPIFDGLYEYCRFYTGASISAARNLTSNQSDIAINWSGGLHHAKKSEASGFCYVNDIVLAILELLRVWPRVLYIDIDVHHGDGVEQAFASSDRVMTLSYHRYDPDLFFPGTGNWTENGPENPNNPGAHHTLNVPLREGIDDAQYINLFRRITKSAIDHFDPSAIVMQCGADSLGGDRIGKFNLNIKAHGECLAFVKSFRLPLLVLGGGGYTARNVARLWCHETSLCVDAKLSDPIPEYVPYRQAFEGAENGDGLLYPRLHDIEGKRHENAHTPQYLNMIVEKLEEQLRYIKGAPSVQMRTQPPDVWALREELDRDRREEDEGQGLNGGDYEDLASRREKERNIGGRGEMMA